MTRLGLVLLVDDDEISNFISEKEINRSKLVNDLRIKLNGQQAANFFDECSDKYPDLVLLDINMPLMNGFEFLEYFENAGYSGKTKFAILSTSTHTVDKDMALNFKDVIGFVEKPLTTEKIQNLIDKL